MLFWEVNPKLLHGNKTVSINQRQIGFSTNFKAEILIKLKKKKFIMNRDLYPRHLVKLSHGHG